MASVTRSEIASMIDHSLLRPELSTEQLEAGCALAAEFETASVCCMPSFVSRCSEILAGSKTHVSTVIGFPLGYVETEVKLLEIDRAIDNGAVELDAVINISHAVSDEFEKVHADIAAMRERTAKSDVKLKIIFENCYLTDAQKIKLCEICSEVGVDWVKTSSGFGTGGATVEDLRLMRAHSAANVSVKAAGGVRTLEKLLEMREIGVNRFGATATRTILEAVDQL